MDTELVNAVLAMDDNTKPKKFVVVIDTQFDFVMPDGALYVTDAQSTVLPTIQYLYGLKPEETAGVLFTFDTHHKETYEGSEEAKQFPIHCVYKTPGWQNVYNKELVDNRIEVVTLEKGVFNMWEEDTVLVYGIDGRPLAFDSDRDHFFESLLEDGVRDVVIIGVAADFCVKWAADGFLARGFNVEVPRRLTRGIVRDIDTVVREDYAGKNIKVTA